MTTRSGGRFFHGTGDSGELQLKGRDDVSDVPPKRSRMLDG